eukprot:4209503-Amphidinium_carterae.2
MMPMQFLTTGFGSGTNEVGWGSATGYSWASAMYGCLNRVEELRQKASASQCTARLHKQLEAVHPNQTRC